MSKKILLIEDDYIIANDIKSIVESDNDDYQIVGIADNFSDGLKLFYKTWPEIILCDIYIKGKNTGIDLIKEIRKFYPVPVIFITANDKLQVLDSLCNLKNIAYVTKPFTTNQILSAIKLQTVKFYDHTINPDLSERENQIAMMLTQGMKSKEIASFLSLSVETIKSHKKNIYSKLGIHSLVNLTMKIKDQ